MENCDKLKFSIYKLVDQSNIVEDLTTRLQTRGYKQKYCEKPDSILFLNQGESKPPTWRNFLSQVSQDPDIFALTKKNPSFVLLHSIEGKHYAIAGGGGHLHINAFVEEDFGIDAICRILDPDRIKALTQGQFVGSIVQQEKIFRNFYDYNLDASNLSKLTKEIFGEINAKMLKKVFKLTRRFEKTSKLSGKRCFWLGVSVSYEELVSVITALHQINQLERKIDNYRGYEQIKDKILLERLNEALSQELKMQYEEYCQNPDRHLDTRVHVSYSDAKELLLCDHFSMLHSKIKKELNSKEPDSRLLNLTTVFSVLHQNDFKEFSWSLMDRIRIVGLDGDGEPTNVDGHLRKFIYAEIPEGDRVYYFYGGTWYVLSNEFEEQIHKKTAEIIGACSDPLFALPEWKDWRTSGKEDDYINEACSDPTFVKMHKVPVYFHTGSGNSELCDIVSAQASPNLVFIKRGTGVSLRDLFSQARMSVQLFKGNPKFREEAISKVYSQERRPSRTKMSFDRCGVVLAIIDNSPNRSKKSLCDKLSVLAKLELLDCVQFLRNECGIDRIIIHEIKRAAPLKPVLKQSMDFSAVMS